MKDRDVRGTLPGLLALVGLILWVWWQLSFLFHVVSLSWAFLISGGVLPSVAWGLGVCLLVVALRGNGRVLWPVRFDRRLEYPPDPRGGGRP